MDAQPRRPLTPQRGQPLLQSGFAERPWIIAVILAVGVTLWVLSGQFGDAESKSTPVSSLQAEQAQPLVKVRDVVAEEIETVLEIRGHTEAWTAVSLAAETEGRIVEVFRDAGDRLEAGEAILRIDPRARAEVLKQASAVAEQRRAEARAAERLHRSGHVTDTELARAAAAVAAAEADLKRATLDLQATWVRSPIDGRLESRVGEVGDYLKIGTTIATVIELHSLRLVASVTEQSVADLKVGQPVIITGVDSKNWPEGKVHFVGGQADTATRTYRVEVRVPNAAEGPAGESVRGRIVTGRTRAHRLPIGLVDLDSTGGLGLFTVTTDSDQVERHPVRIVRTEAGDAWFTGLPDEARVITRGQGFVLPGQTVRIATEG